MDTLLVHGDHYRDSRGLPTVIYDLQELVQRALIRLSLKKGNFILDPALGSELHRLPLAVSLANNRAALSFAQEALRPMAGLLTVQSAVCKLLESGHLAVDLTIAAHGESYLLEVTAG